MIRDRFVQTREAVIELDYIKAKLSEQGDDWHPERIKGTEVPDPTGNKAAYNVDELGPMLEELRKREGELERFIGTTLAIIEGVREGLGDLYAAILDQRYIDGLPWSQVMYEGKQVKASTGKAKVSLAFDWIDSLGVTRVLGGDYEL